MKSGIAFSLFKASLSTSAACWNWGERMLEAIWFTFFCYSGKNSTKDSFSSGVNSLKRLLMASGVRILDRWVIPLPSLPFAAIRFACNLWMKSLLNNFSVCFFFSSTFGYSCFSISIFSSFTSISIGSLSSATNAILSLIAFTKSSGLIFSFHI